MLTKVFDDEVPRHLKDGEWRITARYASGRTKTYRHQGYDNALRRFWKAANDRRNQVKELYLSCVTDLAGELAFLGLEGK